MHAMKWGREQSVCLMFICPVALVMPLTSRIVSYENIPRKCDGVMGALGQSSGVTTVCSDDALFSVFLTTGTAASVLHGGICLQRP